MTALWMVPRALMVLLTCTSMELVPLMVLLTCASMEPAPLVHQGDRAVDGAPSPHGVTHLCLHGAGTPRPPG